MNQWKRWLKGIYDISSIQNLILLLKNRIGSSVSYSKNIARSLLKEPKLYFYDHNYANNDDGAKLENILANALIKECSFLHDTQGISSKLHYLRTKDGKEIYFLITQDVTPTHMIEMKTSDKTPHPAFKHLQKLLPETQQPQLVKELKRESTLASGLEIRALLPWLTTVNLTSKTSTWINIINRLHSFTLQIGIFVP